MADCIRYVHRRANQNTIACPECSIGISRRHRKGPAPASDEGQGVASLDLGRPLQQRAPRLGIESDHRVVAGDDGRHLGSPGHAQHPAQRFEVRRDVELDVVDALGVEERRASGQCGQVGVV